MQKLQIRAENFSNYITSYHHSTQLIYTKALFTLNWTLTDYCQHSLGPNVLFNDAVSPYGRKGLNVSQHDVTKEHVHYFGHLMSFGTQLFRRRMSPSLSNGKAVPLQAWSGPEGSTKLRFPDFMTTAQDGGKVVSLKHRPPLTPRNTPGTHFC